MSRILVVEDEAHLADGLRFNLEAEGYSVAVANDGETALELLKPEIAASQAETPTDETSPFDAIVLDVMLPGIDGFAVAAELRKRGQFLPILMLTARGRSEDVLRGFESGADDYLPKPFVLDIFLARIAGLIRRREWLRLGMAQANISATAGDQPEPSRIQQEPTEPTYSDKEIYPFAGKVLDFGALQLRIGERVVQLTMMEADLFRYLVRHEGQVVSRKAMLGDVWGLHEDTDTRAIDNFIVRLRRYIETEPSSPRHLLTVRGVGYRFVAEPDAE